MFIVGVYFNIIRLLRSDKFGSCLLSGIIDITSIWEFTISPPRSNNEVNDSRNDSTITAKHRKM